MKKLFFAVVLACTAVISYAQRDVKPGRSLEVAGVEQNDNNFYIYKVKDNDGNPAYYLSVSRVEYAFEAEILNSTTTFSSSNGTVLLFGETYEDAQENLEELLEMFTEDDGEQKEFTCLDGSKVPCTLHKGCLGKHLSIGEASLTKGNIKSLRYSLKVSKKLHPDI